jgi:glycerol-3-phosphate O-acyltransferase
MYVNFGEFISVRESLGEPLSSPYLDDAIFTKNVQDMALNVILDHQKHLATPLFAAVATIIIGKISEGQKSIGFQTLTHQIHSFRALINPKGK